MGLGVDWPVPTKTWAEANCESPTPRTTPRTIPAPPSYHLPKCRPMLRSRLCRPCPRMRMPPLAVTPFSSPQPRIRLRTRLVLKTGRLVVLLSCQQGGNGVSQSNPKMCCLAALACTCLRGCAVARAADAPFASVLLLFSRFRHPDVRQLVLGALYGRGTLRAFCRPACRDVIAAIL